MFEYYAKVKRVVDGDTIDFEVDLGFKVKIDIRGRLLGVDTPERGHEDWAKATEMCHDLVRSVADKYGWDDQDEQLYVVIKTHKTEKYGRWLVEIDGVTNKLAEIWPYEE